MKQFVSTGRPAGGLAAVSFFDGLVFFAPVSLLVRTTAGVTVSQFFLLQAAIACTVLAAELPAGRLTDRIGCRSTIVLCEGGFLAARALLLAAFLTRSLPLFVLEAAVEGLAISFESGTRSAYLYLTVPPELYLTRTARVENWGTAGFIASTVCYAGLYALWGLTGLLAATVCTSALAFLSALRLPQVLALAPAEALLLARDEHLDVDVLVVDLELGVGALLEFALHHVDVDVASFEFMDTRLHLGPVGRGDQFEGLFHARVHRSVERAVFQRIENHGCKYLVV